MPADPPPACPRSQSSGDAPTKLGLRGHLVREGLAYRLFNGDPMTQMPDSIVRTADTPLATLVGPWVSLERTRRLAEDVFIHRSGIPDGWSHWPDPSTIGIPNYYAWVYYALAQSAALRGNGAEVERFTERGEAWALLGDLRN